VAPVSRIDGPGRVGARLLGCLALGVAVGVVGTGVHRLNPPLGILLAYLTVASSAVLARAWVGARGMLALAAGLLATVGAMTFVRPGDDVIIADQAVGWAWLAGVLVVGLVGLLPRRMFDDHALGRPDGPAGRP